MAGPLQLHSFGLGELRGVTHDFSSSFLLGEGGFGAVYKGFVDAGMRPGLDAQPVAVKQLNAAGFQGHREWLAEVIFLGQFRHPHLVRLLGYCCEDEERLLVYEFMPRGSLENHQYVSDQEGKEDIFLARSHMSEPPNGQNLTECRRNGVREKKSSSKGM